MTTYQGPVVIARGMYLGLSPDGDRAVWLSTADEQREFPKEMAPYLEFASAVLLKDEFNALMSTLEHGSDAIRVLTDVNVVLELPKDVDGALRALTGMQIHPLNVKVSIADGVTDDGQPIHDITVRRLAGQDELVIPHPISTVIEDREHDLPDAIRKISETTGVDIRTVLGQVIDQLGYLIVSRIGFLTSDLGHGR